MQPAITFLNIQLSNSRVLSECRQEAEFYPAYLKEKQEGNVLLSDKALTILRLQSEGLSVEKIAAQIGLSKAGVKYYNPIFDSWEVKKRLYRQ